MEIWLLLTGYRQHPIRWYHRRPLTTYRLATIPHDWHTIVGFDSSRSSKINDFHVIWKPICNFLFVINSNIGPITHRLATIHPSRTDGQTDGQTTLRAVDVLQHSCSTSKTIGQACIRGLCWVSDAYLKLISTGNNSNFRISMFMALSLRLCGQFACTTDNNIVSNTTTARYHWRLYMVAISQRIGMSIIHSTIHYYF